MADAGTPDWWLDRLYKRLRERQPQIKVWDDWYTRIRPRATARRDRFPAHDLRPRARRRTRLPAARPGQCVKLPPMAPRVACA